MSQSKTYPLPDPAATVAKIAAEGGPKIDPTQTSGQASDCGVTLAWSIGAGTNIPTQITIAVISKPFLIPYSTIWSHVDALFAD